jgi:hypothetical protein
MLAFYLSALIYCAYFSVACLAEETKCFKHFSSCIEMDYSAILLV